MEKGPVGMGDCLRPEEEEVNATSVGHGWQQVGVLQGVPTVGMVWAVVHSHLNKPGMQSISLSLACAGAA